MTAVILPFPKEKRPTPGDPPEVVYARVETAQKERADVIVDETVGQVYNAMEIYGIPFDPENEEVLKGTALVVEALKSLIYGISGYTHPLQPISDSIFNVLRKRGQAPVVVISDNLIHEAESLPEEANTA